MIVKMEKVTIFTPQKHAAETLLRLRRLGVVHLRHMRRPHAHYINTLLQRLQLLDEALAILAVSDKQKTGSSSREVLDAAKRIVELHHRKQALFARCKVLDEKLIWFKRWGNVSLAAIEDLKKAGLYLRLYQASKRDLKRLPKTSFIHIVAVEKGNVYLAFFGTNSDAGLPFTEITVPSESVQSVRRKIFVLYKEMGGINSELAYLACYQQAMKVCKRETEKKLEFYQARFGMYEQEGLCVLQGYCPKEAVTTIKETARECGWGLILEEPDDIQDVPTLVRYPRWTKGIEPVFKFMGTLPGYNEFDISPCFLIFFSLFFAMLIGDAGYGLLFLVGTQLARRKFPQAPQPVFTLAYVLAVATIIWGAISGDWFGFEGVGKLPFFNSLIIRQLNAFVISNQLIVMNMCFFIGALHLSIAHAMAAVRYSNSRRAFSQLGWIAIIWGVYFLAGNLVLQRPLPVFSSYLFIAGLVLVAAFSHSHKNIIKGIAVSIAGLPLKLINSFADTLSYLRLFAVGYASVMVAASFNEMALAVGFHSVVRSFGSALILLFGHSLNIILGFMSVLVHGIRLNMLEFSSHLGMEWSGKQYQPFKE